MPSFGGEVKQSVPCPNFGHVKNPNFCGELRAAG
jgi:hypothetical protein